MDFTNLDEQIGMMFARIELEGETCHLKHSSVDPAENHLAVDYLCQNMGDPKTGEIKQQLRVPVCQECAEALYDKDWILVFCVNCQKSQWIYRPYAKKEHPAGNIIYWMDVCPFCGEIANEWKEDK